VPIGLFLSTVLWSNSVIVEAQDLEARDILPIWNQKKLPVIFRPARSETLKIRLPFAKGNSAWLQGDRQHRQKWNEKWKCWETPRSWFDDIGKKCVAQFGRVYVIHTYRLSEKCAPRCWEAERLECQCSCMGANHGSQGPLGKWLIISETFAVRWQERRYACRLIARRTETPVRRPTPDPG
jgi:hypothetical protein